MNQGTNAFLRIEKLAKGKIEGFNEWDEIPLVTDVMLIGRLSKTPDAIEPDIKVIGDDYISRNHAEIFYSFSDCCFTLRDTGSMNGSFLNGELLEKDRPYPLKDQSLIGLARISGEMRVIFRFRTSWSTLPSWAQEDPAKTLSNKGLAINFAARRVYVTGKEIPLTGKEYKILEVLYNNRGNACSIDDLAFEVWGEKAASGELIAKHISRLREKIELDPSNPCYILTVPGRHGCYRLET